MPEETLCILSSTLGIIQDPSWFADVWPPLPEGSEWVAARSKRKREREQATAIKGSAEVKTISLSISVQPWTRRSSAWQWGWNFLLLAMLEPQLCSTFVFDCCQRFYTANSADFQQQKAKGKERICIAVEISKYTEKQFIVCLFSWKMGNGINGKCLNIPECLLTTW